MISIKIEDSLCLFRTLCVPLDIIVCSVRYYCVFRWILLRVPLDIIACSVGYYCVFRWILVCVPLDIIVCSVGYYCVFRWILLCVPLDIIKFDIAAVTMAETMPNYYQNMTTHDTSGFSYTSSPLDYDTHGSPHPILNGYPKCTSAMTQSYADCTLGLSRDLPLMQDIFDNSSE